MPDDPPTETTTDANERVHRRANRAGAWGAALGWAVLDLVTILVVVGHVAFADYPGTLSWSGGYVHNDTDAPIRVVPLAMLEGEDGERRLGLVPHFERVDALGFERELAPIEIAPGATTRVLTWQPDSLSFPVSLLVERDDGSWGRRIGRWEIIGPGYERSTVRIEDRDGLDDPTAAELAVLRSADPRPRPSWKSLALAIAVVLPVRLFASLVAWSRVPRWLRTGRRELVLVLPVVGLAGIGLFGSLAGFVATLVAALILLVSVERAPSSSA